MLLWERVGSSKLPKHKQPAAIQPISTRLRSIQQPNRCKALTRVGRPCRCRRAQGSEFCAFHDPVISVRIREKARAAREARRREMEALPGGYLKSLTSVDGVAAALDCLFREVRQGIVSPRTAAVLVAIIDRLLAYDQMVATVGTRRVNKRKRAKEVRDQLVGVLGEMKSPRLARPVTTSLPSNSPAVSAAPPAKTKAVR